mmetsp:Transcript_58584/g.152273  ORF Transcript_58584/g.152273 Transcript_58584/m.152273 type:complete len:221 (-) Transcript_58584:1258-1920(-)
MAKGEGRLEVVVAVAGLRALAVFHVVPRARRDLVVLRGREHQRQSSGGGLITEEDAGPGGARLLPPQEHDQDAIRRVHPRGHEGAGGLHQHHHGLPAPIRHRAYEVSHAAIEGEAVAVPRLSAGGGRHDDDEVRSVRRLEPSLDVIGRRRRHLDARGSGAARDALQRRDQAPGHHVAAAASGVVVASRPVAAPVLAAAAGIVRVRRRRGTEHGDLAHARG